MTESTGSRRNIIIVAAIAVVAVVIIVITAVATSGSSSSPEAAAAPEAVPDFEGMLVDEHEVGSLMNADMNMTNGFDGLNTPLESSTNPVECNFVSSFADSWEYAETPWRFARSETFFEADGGANQTVEQAVILLDTPEHTQAFFDKVKADWDSCNGQTYIFPDSVDRWNMKDYDATADMLVEASVAEGDTTEWSCQRAFGIKSMYVAEVRVCGNGSGQAKKIAEEILSGVEA